jgi:hypothetical protein
VEQSGRMHKDQYQLRLRITIFMDELDLEKFKSLHMRFKPSIGKKFQLDLEETTYKSI